MKLTFKIVLDKRYMKGDDTYPLKVRVYYGTSYKEKSVDVFIRETDWDAANQLVLPSCKSHEVYNTKIMSVKTRVQKQILLGELNEDQDVLPEDIIKAISGTATPKVKVVKTCIIKYGEDIII